METIPLLKHDRIVLQLLKEKRELVAACELALLFIECVYREHGRDYLPNAGDAMEQVQAAIANANG